MTSDARCGPHARRPGREWCRSERRFVTADRGALNARKMCRKVLCCRGKAVPIELQRPEALCKYQL